MRFSRSLRAVPFIPLATGVLLLCVAATGAAAPVYGPDPSTTPGNRVAEIARALPDLTYSPRLADAADEIARRAVEERTVDLSPTWIEDAVLEAGAADIDVLPVTVAVTGDGRSEVAEQLSTAAAARDEPLTHLGIGRAPFPDDPFRWMWVGLLARRRAALESTVPCQVPAGAVVEPTFRLDEGLAEPHLVVVHPEGRIERIDLRPTGDGVGARVAARSHPGPMWIHLVVTGDQGNEIVGQMRLVVGDEDGPEPSSAQARAVSGTVASSRAAENELMDLVNATRRRHGLAELQPDPELAEAARAHSLDMRDSGFFGHVSPTRGDLDDRLESAGYRYRTARENLSRDTSVESAHRSLLASPSHRANLLSPDETRIGIGVVPEVSARERPAFYITEIFAAPLVAPDASETLSQAVRRLRGGRRSAGKSPLRRDPRLDDAAAQLARLAAGGMDAGNLLGAARSALRERGLSWDELSVDRFIAPDLGMIDLSGVASRHRADAFGAGSAAVRDRAVVALVILTVRTTAPTPTAAPEDEKH